MGEESALSFVNLSEVYTIHQNKFCEIAHALVGHFFFEPRQQMHRERVRNMMLGMISAFFLGCGSWEKQSTAQVRTKCFIFLKVSTCLEWGIFFTGKRKSLGTWRPKGRFSKRKYVFTICPSPPSTYHKSNTMKPILLGLMTVFGISFAYQCSSYQDFLFSQRFGKSLDEELW